MVEVDKGTFLKEAKELSDLAKEVVRSLMDVHNDYERGIPNMVVLADNQVQFNVVMNEMVKNLRMNFSVYEAGINSYLLELVSYIPAPDFIFPPDAIEANMLYKVSGSPILGAHRIQKPISALSINEAIEAALEYTYDNMLEIMKEILGAEGI